MDIKCEIRSAEDRKFKHGNLTSEARTASARSHERSQILKNRAEEKEAVLTIHERARQEWELERTALMALVDEAKSKRQL